MLEVFSQLADLLVYDLGGLTAQSKLGDALHFFVEDSSKIFVLLLVMIYAIALVRAGLDVQRIRVYLQKRRRASGYLFGATFGAITPFCSCSSIPLFLGFTSARIPLGISMAFLITSPLINEVAVVMLASLLGWKFTLIYIIAGMSVGMLGGWLLDALRAERWLAPFILEAQAAAEAQAAQPLAPAAKLSLQQRHAFAKAEMLDIFGRVWKWVIIGVGLGAGLHGFVPDGWIAANLGGGQWWSVPIAVLVGIPLYSNATGVIPVMQGLLVKGLPLGTTLAFCMSTVAASFPEFILLKQVMQLRLLALLFALLLVAFILVGWLFNALEPWILS